MNQTDHLESMDYLSRRHLVADFGAALGAGDEAQALPLAQLAVLAHSVLIDEKNRDEIAIEPAGIEVTKIAGTVLEGEAVMETRLPCASAQSEVESGQDFIARVSEQTTFMPASLLSGLKRRLAAEEAAVDHLPSGSERIMPLAAAGTHDDHSVHYVGDAGVWTLDLFTDGDPAIAREGTLLIEIDPDSRAAYEGRWCKVYVTGPDGTIELARARVAGGKARARVMLAGLDTRHRDALSLCWDGIAYPNKNDLI